MVLRALVPLGLVTTLLGALACGDPVATDVLPDRMYTIIEFNGAPAPGIVLVGGGSEVELHSGRFVLGGEGDCAAEFSFRNPVINNGAPFLTGGFCTWTASESTLSFSWGGLGPSSGTLVGERLTVTHPPGVICVAGPCHDPSQWTAVFVEEDVPDP